MALAVKVQGGTGAGIRPPMQDRAPDWRCDNGHDNRGAWTRCLTANCNQKRPKR